jgi:uncharacterized protein YbjT (DUF2867 family)
MHVVTGVFSFTGRYIADELLAQGETVKTLSRRQDPAHPLHARVHFGRLAFDEAGLTAELRGASTLYNTYWIRFPRGDVTWDMVLRNTRTLLRAARAAGVERIVHFSVSNAAEDSPFPYFRAKAVAESAVRGSGLAYDILRPTLIVGRDDVLLNNIAWGLRRLPLFAIAGDGRYRVQPVAATDVARIAVESGRDPRGRAFDVAGPEALTFESLVLSVRTAVGARARIVHVPVSLARALAGAAGRALGDVLVTREELQALTSERLLSREPPTGTTRFADWLAREGAGLGAAFVSDRRRHWEPESQC